MYRNIITFSAVHNTNFHSGAPPCMRHTRPSPEKETAATCGDPRSGHASNLRRLRVDASYMLTVAFNFSVSADSATASKRRLLVSARAVIPPEAVPPINWYTCDGAVRARWGRCDVIECVVVALRREETGVIRYLVDFRSALKGSTGSSTRSQQTRSLGAYTPRVASSTTLYCTKSLELFDRCSNNIAPSTLLRRAAVSRCRRWGNQIDRMCSGSCKAHPTVWITTRLTNFDRSIGKHT